MSGDLPSMKEAEGQRSHALVEIPLFLSAEEGTHNRTKSAEIMAASELREE